MSTPTRGPVITNDEGLRRAELRLAAHEIAIARLRKAIADYQLDQAFARYERKFAELRGSPASSTIASSPTLSHTQDRHYTPTPMNTPPQGSPGPSPMHTTPEGDARSEVLNTPQGSPGPSPMRTTPDRSTGSGVLNRDPAENIPGALPLIDDFRLRAVADGNLQGWAQDAGVDYTALVNFLRSDEVHTFAWEFLKDHGSDREFDRWVMFFAFDHWDREKAWCDFFVSQDQLIWLRQQVEHGLYGRDGQQFDPSPWVRDDDLPIDKSRFLFADHITRFVLLCENYRIMSGRVEWSNENFGRPDTRIRLYKAICMLFMRAYAADVMAGRGAGA